MLKTKKLCLWPKTELLSKKKEQCNKSLQSLMHKIKSNRRQNWLNKMRQLKMSNRL